MKYGESVLCIYFSKQNGIHHHDPPHQNLQKNTRKLNHNNSGKKDYRKIVEYIIEDALQTLAEHYIEDYLIDFHVGDGHDEESPIYEWLPQDILKSILEHYIIEPGVKYAIHFTDNEE